MKMRVGDKFMKERNLFKFKSLKVKTLGDYKARIVEFNSASKTLGLESR